MLSDEARVGKAQDWLLGIALRSKKDDQCGLPLVATSSSKCGDSTQSKAIESSVE